MLREGGQPQAALSLIHDQRGRIKDKLGATMEEAALQLEVGSNAEAEAIYRCVLPATGIKY